MILFLLRFIEIAELFQELVVGSPELQFVEPVPGRLGQLYRRFSLGHCFHHSTITTYSYNVINYLMVLDSLILNINLNKTIIFIINNILMCFDSSLYIPVQICMRRTP